MVITIDGPAGSGKSSVARKLAARLGIAYLDTGAMYRAIAYAALERETNVSNPTALLDLARSVRLELDCGPTYTRVRVDGRDVSEAIRTLSVSTVTSQIATFQVVRDDLVAKQREIGQRLGSFVAEGRDQGSIVFPQADAKFVLEASLSKRAQRRLQELQVDGEEVDTSEVERNLFARDKIDAKQWESLLTPGAAIVIDTTHLAIHEVLDRIVASLPPSET